MTEVLEFATSLAREVGEEIVALRQNSPLVHQFKQDNELVTNADLLADKMICTRIKEHYPDHLIVSEESSPDIDLIRDKSASIWIIDPIDGTVNFAHGHIQSAISIAFVEEGQIKAGIVYNPFTDEMFSASLGKGAFLNGVALQVSEETELSRAIIATGFPYDKSTIEPMIDRVGVILRNCADIRRLGSAALDICWLAAGRLDGYYESLSIWDFAAAQLIAKEAGAQFGHFSDVPAGVDPQFHDKDILVANPALYPKLLGLLKTT